MHPQLDRDAPPDEPFLLPVPDDAASDLAALWVDLGGGG